MSGTPETQFDFWLGEWDCAWDEDGKGTNHIRRILDGRIIQENFSAPDLKGMSVSVYDLERQLWCQTWVDNTGSYLDFTGVFEDGRMILVRDAIVKGEACKQRMVWYNIEADQFDWNWERSDDNGQTWRVLWKIRYTRKLS
ncbi:MAG: hypothetical protein DPW18_20810 [Chloroflexi bacterium]|nr:hypothetical protein [Chloroflexota bacterium]MDL1942507.1 hypothetical protein [Chloroflexi bacterium CFX2]